MSMKTTVDYWFTIEPYVFVSVTNCRVLLYNTLDKMIIESDKSEVVDLLREMLEEKSSGVVLLTNERYEQKNINDFVHELRGKYMGDIIDVSLSKGKPVQLLPYCNFSNKLEIYKKHNFSQLKNVLENLSEITIYLDATINKTRLISFIQSIPVNITFNISGNIKEVGNYNDILFCFDKLPSPKNILCSYKNIIPIQPVFGNNFLYRISIDFPIDIECWNYTRRILLNQSIPVEYIFDVLSEDDCVKAEQFVKEYDIGKYRIIPRYTGDNIRFFEDNVFLSKDDILSTSLTIKDFFARKSINIYDFGKIYILPNGNAFANLNHSVLGNIYVNNIYEIVQKEVDEGKSWFRIRNQAPCTDCIYQWICPPPSNYEIAIGRPNLCHVINDR